MKIRRFNNLISIWDLNHRIHYNMIIEKLTTVTNKNFNFIDKVKKKKNININHDNNPSIIPNIYYIKYLI